MTDAAMRFDPEELTLEECDDIEEVSQQRFAQVLADIDTCAFCRKPHDNICGECGAVHLFDPQPAIEPLYDHPWKSRFDHVHQPNVTAKEMLAIGWILGRRQDPNFTLEDARASKLSGFGQRNGQFPKE